MPGVSSGKRSIKNLTAASYQGASASQKVNVAQWAGELPWTSASPASASRPVASQQYDLSLPHVAYVTEDGLPGGTRYPKCLLCDKWMQDDFSHSGTHASPAGSKEHLKNLRNCLPGDPWYEEHVRRARERWHPGTSAAAAAPGHSAGQASASFAATTQPSPQQFDLSLPYIAYLPEDGTPGAPRFPKCLLCDKWVQDRSSHSGSHSSPAGSKEHSKNLRNWLPGTPWYEEHVRRVRETWHPEAAAPAAPATHGAGPPPPPPPPTQASQPPQQFDLCLPYIAYLPEDGTPGAPRYPKCLLCDKWVQDPSSHTGTHLAPAGSNEHAKKLRNCLPSHPWYEENVRRIRQMWHPDAAATAAAAAAEAAAAEAAPATPADPCIEVRDGQQYCLACRRWATEGHCASDGHIWRAQQWGQDDVVVGDSWIQNRQDGPFCLACDKYATREHVLTGKHIWRAQVWAALGHATEDPGDIIAVRVTEVPKAKRGGAEIKVEAVNTSDVPMHVSADDFQSWPLPPRIKDVLLVAAAPLHGTGVPKVQPRLSDACPLGDAELVFFAKKLEPLCRVSPRETCRQMVAEYYRFYQDALQRADSGDAVVPLLRALRHVTKEAMSDANDGYADSAMRRVLVDAMRSALIGEAGPEVVVSSDVDVGMCRELAMLLIQFLPSGLSLVRPLLQACMERRLKEVKEETIPEVVDGDELPAHWTTSPLSFGKQGWKAVLLEEGGSVFTSLQHALATEPSDLGCESRTPGMRGSYSKLALRRAWRIESPGLLDRFLKERQRMRSQRYELELQALPKASTRQPLVFMPQMSIRAEVQDALGELPDDMSTEVNEVRLLAGANPEDILLLCREGLNPNANGGKFGKGSHLAEDAGCCDQNAMCDASAKNKELKDLHAKLFTKVAKHPGNIYYVFVCRVVLGFFVRANTGGADARALGGEAGPVYATGTGELASIPGTSPTVPYHSLVVEVGDQLRRYREFVQFDSQRIYPEYLLAYERV